MPVPAHAPAIYSATSITEVDVSEQDLTSAASGMWGKEISPQHASQIYPPSGQAAKTTTSAQGLSCSGQRITTSQAKTALALPSVCAIFITPQKAMCKMISLLIT